MKTANRELSRVLRRTRELVEASEDSPWTPWEVAEIRSDFDQILYAIESGGPVNKVKLELLLMPTGPIQETSIDNGWADEMLLLAEGVDKYIEAYKAARPWWQF